MRGETVLDVNRAAAYCGEVTDLLTPPTFVPSADASVAFWADADKHVLRYGSPFVPEIIDRAEGSFIYTEAGRKILDFTSGQMSAILGHSHPDVVATVQEVCAGLGKHAVTCGDRSGFIVNALLFPYLNDAVKMLEANYATADAIDTAMKTGCGLPMGTFELLDVVGLDVALAIQRELYLEFREPGFAPAPLLEHLVTAGYLGRKTGRGFRTYA